MSLPQKPEFCLVLLEAEWGTRNRHNGIQISVHRSMERTPASVLLEFNIAMYLILFPAVCYCLVRLTVWRGALRLNSEFCMCAQNFRNMASSTWMLWCLYCFSQVWRIFCGIDHFWYWNNIYIFIAIIGYSTLQ